MSEEWIDLESEDNDKVDYIALLKSLWNGRKIVIICLVIGIILGVFIAISSPGVYTSSTVMVPQTGNSGNKASSQLGGLAALAGISIDMTQQNPELSPIIYPKIVNSIPFKLELMNSPVKFEDFDKPISLLDYYTNPNFQKFSILGIVKKYTIGLPVLIIKSLKEDPKDLKYYTNNDSNKNQPIQLTEDQYQMSKMLDDIVSLDVEVKDGYLTLTVQMPEALAAAQVAQNAQQLLRKYITNFKIQKAKADLDFIQGRYDVLKGDAERVQYSIAVKSDRFKDLITNVPQVETNRMQVKYAVSNGVFQELAKQLEQAKIQVKKDTPVFTTVEPVTIPMKKTSSRMLVVLTYMFISGLISLVIIFGKPYFTEFKQKWNEK